MNIIEGISSGAVLQRDNENFCRIKIKAEFTGTPKVSFGKIEKQEGNIWIYSGLFVGGPYTVIFSDDESSLTFTDIYVGDVWLLAGQSNMEGMGRRGPAERLDTIMPNPFIRAFMMDHTWGGAIPKMHNLFVSKDVSISAHINHSIETCPVFVAEEYPMDKLRGVGPGLYMAQRMFELTNVPQGLVACAVGGTPIERWVPVKEGEENFYTNAVRALKKTGCNVKGMFWCQGEGNPNSEIYPSQLQSIRDDICRQLGLSELPTVVGQLSKLRSKGAFGAEASLIWSRFREMQRKLPETLPRITTVSANDLSLDDTIHISTEGQKILGRRFADAMDHLITGAGYAEPEIDCVIAEKDICVPDFINIKIRYKNLNGDLCSSGVPSGYSFKDKRTDEQPSGEGISNITLRRNEVIIRTEMGIDELKNHELWYDWGNSSYCNITDGSNRALHSQGPIELSGLEV